MMGPEIQQRVLAALQTIQDNATLRQLVFELTQIDFCNLQEEHRLWGVINAQNEELHRLRLIVAFKGEEDQEPK